MCLKFGESVYQQAWLQEANRSLLNNASSWICQVSGNVHPPGCCQHSQKTGCWIGMNISPTMPWPSRAGGLASGPLREGKCGFYRRSCHRHGSRRCPVATVHGSQWQLGGQLKHWQILRLGANFFRNTCTILHNHTISHDITCTNGEKCIYNII